MAFRDESEALRARIEALEAELDEARERVRELEAKQLEAAPLEARIAELEAELAKHAPGAAPEPPATAPTTSRPQERHALRVAIGAIAVVAVAGVAWAFVTLNSGPVLDGPPERGVVNLDQASLPPGLSGTARGATEASSGCPGYVSENPFVVLQTTTARRVQLWTESGADLVLFVQTADGQVRCDDDSGDSMNAALTLDLGPGDHRVWVGTFAEDASAPFTLRIDGRTLEEAALALDAEPTLGTIRIMGVDRHVLDGQTLGDHPASLARAACPGHVPTGPHLDLDVREGGTARISARAFVDLVLLVRRPDGSFVCDDDSGDERDPLLVEELQSGHYRIWVGTFAASQQTDFQLSVEVDRPPQIDPSAQARLGRWDLDAESVLSFSDRVEGRIPVSSTHPECRTLFGSESPDLELALLNARTVTLTLTSDATLGVLIEHPDGTQTCQPAVRPEPQAWAPGSHRVWIASPDPDAVAAFTLVVQTQPP